MKLRLWERSAIIITIFFVIAAVCFGFLLRTQAHKLPFSLQIVGASVKSSEAPGADSETLININTAGLDELCTLHGIGPATAQKIISFRQNLGPFTEISDILDVYGIGFSTFEDIRDHITI